MITNKLKTCSTRMLAYNLMTRIKNANMAKLVGQCYVWGGFS